MPSKGSVHSSRTRTRRFLLMSGCTCNRFRYARPQAGQRRLLHQGWFVQCQDPVNVEEKSLASPFEPPSENGPAGEAPPNATMILQVGRRLRFGVLPKICCRPDDREALPRADGYRNHVLGHVFRKPDAGVKSLVHDVDEASAGCEIEGNCGIPPNIFLEDGPHLKRGCDGSVDPQRA